MMCFCVKITFFSLFISSVCFHGTWQMLTRLIELFDEQCSINPHMPVEACVNKDQSVWKCISQAYTYFATFQPFINGPFKDCRHNVLLNFKHVEFKWRDAIRGRWNNSFNLIMALNHKEENRKLLYYCLRDRETNSNLFNPNSVRLTARKNNNLNKLKPWHFQFRGI